MEVIRDLTWRGAERKNDCSKRCFEEEVTEAEDLEKRKSDGKISEMMRWEWAGERRSR